MDLPIFKYHPDPMGTGAVEKTQDECECCEQRRGYKAASTIYAIDDIETICPWCIANGAAAEKFDGAFSDAHPLLSDGIDPEIVDEVCKRTPGFITWQQERWLSHCDDACEFLGDADKSDLEALSGESLKAFLSAEHIEAEYWPDILAGYEKGGHIAIYKFRCRGCGQHRFYADTD